MGFLGFFVYLFNFLGGVGIWHFFIIFCIYRIYGMVCLCIAIICLASKQSCLKVLCITPLKTVLLHSCFLTESQVSALVKYDCKSNF